MVLVQSLTFPDSLPSVQDAFLPQIENTLDFHTFTSLRRIVTHQQNKPLVRRGDFMKQVTLFLPEVAARIEETDFGYVHLEMGALKLATKEAFAQSDFAAVRKHLTLIADVFERADEELYDAIRVSYLEAIFLCETSAAHIMARGLLSKSLENALRQAELRLQQQLS